jgi:hypothetical protein
MAQYQVGLTPDQQRALNEMRAEWRSHVPEHWKKGTASAKKEMRAYWDRSVADWTRKSFEANPGGPGGSIFVAARQNLAEQNEPFFAEIGEEYGTMSDQQKALASKWLYLDPTLAKRPEAVYELARSGIDPQSEEGMAALKAIQGKQDNDGIWESGFLSPFKWGMRHADMMLSSFKQLGDVAAGGGGDEFNAWDAAAFAWGLTGGAVFGLLPGVEAPGMDELLEKSGVMGSTTWGQWLQDRYAGGKGDLGTGWAAQGTSGAIAAYERAQKTDEAYYILANGQKTTEWSPDVVDVQEGTIGTRWANLLLDRNTQVAAEDPDRWYYGTISGMSDLAATLALDPTTYIPGAAVSKGGRLLMRPLTGTQRVGKIAKAGDEAVAVSTAAAPKLPSGRAVSAAAQGKFDESGELLVDAVETGQTDQVLQVVGRGSAEKGDRLAYLTDYLNGQVGDAPTETGDIDGLLFLGRTRPRGNRDEVLSLSGANPREDAIGEAIGEVREWATNAGVSQHAVGKVVEHTFGRRVEHLSDKDVALALGENIDYLRRQNAIVEPMRVDAPVRGPSSNWHRLVEKAVYGVTGNYEQAAMAADQALAVSAGTLMDSLDMAATSVGRQNGLDLISELAGEATNPTFARKLEAAAPELARFVEKYAGDTTNVDMDMVAKDLGWTRIQAEENFNLLRDAEILGSPFWDNVDPSNMNLAMPLRKGLTRANAQEMLRRQRQSWNGETLPGEVVNYAEDLIAGLDELQHVGPTGLSVDDFAKRFGIQSDEAKKVLDALEARGMANDMGDGRFASAAATDDDLLAFGRRVYGEASSLYDDPDSIGAVLRQPGDNAWSAGGDLFQRVRGTMRGKHDNGMDARRGISRDGSMTVVSKRFNDWLETRGGTRTLQALVKVDNYEGVQRMLGDRVPAEVAWLLSQSKTVDEAKAVVRQAVGSGKMVEYPFVGTMAALPGWMARPRMHYLNRGRGFRSMVHSGAWVNDPSVALDDTDALLKQTARMFDAVKMDVAERQQIYGALAQASTIPERRRIMYNSVGKMVRAQIMDNWENSGRGITGGNTKRWLEKAQQQRDGVKLSANEMKEAARGRALEKVSQEVTRFFEDTMDLTNDYGEVEAIAHGDAIPEAVLNGEVVSATDPHLWQQMWNRTMPLLDGNELRMLSRRMAVTTRYALHKGEANMGTGTALAAKGTANYFKARDYLLDFWKVGVLMRASYMTRNIVEEVVRGSLWGWGRNGADSWGRNANPWRILTMGMNDLIDFGRTGGKGAYKAELIGPDGARIVSANIDDVRTWRDQPSMGSSMSSMIGLLDTPRGRRYINRSTEKVTYKQGGTVTDGWAEALGQRMDRYAKDPLMGRLAGGWTQRETRLLNEAGLADANETERALWWMKNTKQGRGYAQQMNGTTIPAQDGTKFVVNNNNQLRMQEYVEWANRQVDRATLGSGDLRQAIAEGNLEGVGLTVNGELSSKFVRTLRDWTERNITDDIVEQFQAGTLSRAGGRMMRDSKVDRVVGGFFRNVGDRPLNTLVRQPYFRNRYYAHVEDLMGMLYRDERVALVDDLAERGVLRGRELRLLRKKINTPEPDEALSVSGTLRADDVSDLAKRLAVDDVKQTFYQQTQRQHWAQALRFVAPFIQVTKNSIRVTGKGMLDNPRVTYNILEASQALSQPGSSDIYNIPMLYNGEQSDARNGFFHTDDMGNTRFAYPFTWGLSKLMGSEGAMQGYAESLNLNMNFHPGLGPYHAMSTSMVLPETPQWDGVRKALFPMEYQQRMGLNDATYGMLPPWMTRMALATGFHKDSKEYMARATAARMDTLATSGDYDLGSAEGRAKLIADAQGQARAITLLESATRFFIPTPTTMSYAGANETENYGVRYTRELTGELWKRVEAHGDYKTGLDHFMHDYGEDMWFLGVSTQSSSQGFARANNATDRWLREPGNMEFAKAYPNTWGLFVPESTDPSDLQYNAHARDMIAELGGRAELTGGQLNDTIKDAYGDFVYKQRLLAAGLDTSSDIDDRREIIESVERDVPGWVSNSFTLGWRDEVKAELLEAARSSPDLQVSASILAYDEVYAIALEEYRAELLEEAKDGQGITENERKQAENATLNSGKAFQWHALLDEWATQQGQEDPLFAEIWRRLLRGEFY